MSDEKLVSSSVLSQHPDAADGIIHSATGGGGSSGIEIAVSNGGAGGGDDLPVAAKRVLFVLACASAGLLVLAVSVGVVCRVQCKMQRSADGRAAPSGCGIASARDGKGPPGSMWTTELLRSNQVLLSLNCWQPRINSSFLDVVVCPFVLGGPAGYWESFRVFTF